jgi:predicted DNA-binding protein
MHATEARFPDELWEQLRKLSFDTRKSINSIVVEAVTKYLCEVRKDESSSR